MFKTSLKLFIVNIKLNLFIAFQFIIVLLLSLFMVSSLYSRIEYYVPLKEIMNRKASAVSFSTTYLSRKNYGQFLLDYRISPLKTELSGVSDVFAAYRPYINKNDRTLDVISYDDNVINLFTPGMKEGKWLSENYKVDLDSPEIPAVVFQNNSSYRTGDVLSCSAKTYDNNEIDIKLIIIGELASDTYLFWNKDKHLYDHMSFWKSTSEIYEYESGNNEQAILAIVPNKAVDYLNIVSYYDDANGIVVYDDTISFEDVVLNTSELNLRYGYCSENIWNVNENSITYVKRQLITLLPVVISISIITAISSFCASAIMVKKNIKNYCYIYINGATWNDCILMCLYNALFIAFITIIISMITIVIVSQFSGVNLILNKYSVLISSVTAVCYVLILMILPFKILKNSSPIKLLTQIS